jgi:hypothetical protein
MAGGRHQRKFRPLAQVRQLRGRQMQAVGADACGQRGIAVHQNPCTVAMTQVDGRSCKRLAFSGIKPGLAQLQQLQAALQRARKPLQLGIDTDLAGMGDGVKLGQGQCRQHRGVGRQHGRNGQVAGALPGQCAMHVVLQFPRHCRTRKKLSRTWACS